eukprot:PhF_6_TR2235/c3_g6_i1/m.3771
MGNILRYWIGTVGTLRALQKLPKHNLKHSQLYRGINVDIRDHYNGAVFIRWHAFSNTSASANVVKEFIKPSATPVVKPTGPIFLVRSQLGVHIKDFSEFPKEMKYCYPPIH